MKHALVRWMTPRMALATWLNKVLYAVQIVLTPLRGGKEPHGTDLHAPKRFAPAHGRPGKGRFCMRSSVKPSRSGGSVTCMTPYVRTYEQEWTMMVLQRRIALKTALTQL